MDLASRIDHTILKAEATPAQVQAVIDEALEYGFASVCVNGAYVPQVVRALRGSKVATCAVAGFPLGAGLPAAKALEAALAVKEGAQEIDFVAHLPYLLRADYAETRREFSEVVHAVRAATPGPGNTPVVVKVILETALLMQGVSASEAEARIEGACRAARDSGCDFVKTSTGFHAAGGATVEAVRLLKKHSGNVCGAGFQPASGSGLALKVKAAGGIRTYDQAMQMLEAGADRLGCSASVEIVKAARAAGSKQA
jgi:deoxyribose-phosphate aldolase